MAEVHQEGLQYFAEVGATGQQTKADNFYVGLMAEASLAENAGLSALTEVTGVGYTRQAVPATALGITSQAGGTNDWRLVLSQVTFTAGGTWDTANGWFIATTVDGSGKLIASGALSQPRTLGNGDSLNVTPTIEFNG